MKKERSGKNISVIDFKNKREKLKRVICYILLMSCLQFLLSCRENTPVYTYHEYTIKICSVFGDGENRYVLVEFVFPENSDINTYYIQEIIVKCDSSGGYNYNLIGRNTKNNSQLYIICLSGGTFENKKANICFSGLQSVSNPLLVLTTDEWTVSCDLSCDESQKKTITANTNGIERLEIYNNVVIVFPSDSFDRSKIDVNFFTQFDSVVKPICTSVDLENYYFPYEFYVFDSTSAIDFIRINNIIF